MEKEQEMQVRLSRAWNEVMGRSQKKRIQELWKKVKEEKELSQEDKKLAKILLEHEEYYNLWDAISSPPKKIAEQINPYLHVYLHLAIENQIREENPRQVSRYVSQSSDKHKAIHEIVAIFSEYLFEALKYRKPIDRLKYIQRLNEVSGR